MNSPMPTPDWMRRELVRAVMGRIADNRSDFVNFKTTPKWCDPDSSAWLVPIERETCFYCGQKLEKPGLSNG